MKENPLDTLSRSLGDAGLYALAKYYQEAWWKSEDELEALIHELREEVDGVLDNSYIYPDEYGNGYSAGEKGFALVVKQLLDQYDPGYNVERENN